MEQQAEQQPQAGPQPQTQTGILLLQNGVVPPRVELPVPRPPPPPALPNPRDYAHLLPSVPAGALRAWVAPATTRLEPRIIIVGDPRDRAQLAAGGQLGRRELNGQAVFLDVALDTGFGRQASLWRVTLRSIGACIACRPALFLMHSSALSYAL